jgi:hypothetical protein
MRIPRPAVAIFAIAASCLPLCLTAVASDRDLPDRTSASSLSTPDQITIPGPIKPLLRMAGISQKVPPESVLPQLARSVFFLGYQAGHETEFLILLRRYVRQARELEALAGPDGEIRVNHCEEAGALLQVLGYRHVNPCGQKDLSLITSNPERAFVTIDSGFPLTNLEQALHDDTPFAYSSGSSRVPILLKRTDWTKLEKPFSDDVLDVLLHDPEVARLYWAYSKIDPETGLALQRSIGLGSLLPYAATLDFYGSQICIRSRQVLIPGGAAAEANWKDLVGVSPRSPAEFVTRLLAQDRGWMALYFDTLARVDPAQQARLTQGSRLRRLYKSFRGSPHETPAAGSSFRKAPALLILFTRQQWLPSGEPRVPGNLNMWRLILGGHNRNLSDPEQLLEALVADARLETGSGPLQIYLCLTAMVSVRSQQRQLSTETLLLMASSYADYGSWYAMFAEFPELSDESIDRFIRLAKSIDRIQNTDLRGDALGVFQANLSLWQILARQGEIPQRQLDPSWQLMMTPFERIGSPTGLFDAGEKSLANMMIAASGKANLSQYELVDLLAGPPQTSEHARKIRVKIADRMRSVMDDQRLTTLDTLQELGAGLNAMSHGAPRSDKLLTLAGGLREFELPRPIFTESEKAEWAPNTSRQRHADLQIHSDLTKVIEQPSSPAKLEAARGQLAPFLRDTLVGLVYAYYEPLESQILHINPMFVRSHDFAGVTVAGEEHLWQPASLFGAGSSAGGGAYLVGSLSDLPYILASTEQNFIPPTNVQALIWEELVPSLVADATITRWWNVTPHELHAVSLYQRTGEEIISGSVGNADMRDKVTVILADRLSPQRRWLLDNALERKNVTDAVAQLTPTDTFYLAVEFRRRFPRDEMSLGGAAQELEKLSRELPEDVSFERISRDFGIPHPILAQTYRRDLLNGKPFPAFSGYSNRLFGESWDSNNLYWARLADDNNDSPESLNIVCPQLTRLMVARIFASDLEDWAEVVRAMHEAKNDFAQSNAALSQPIETVAQR